MGIGIRNKSQKVDKIICSQKQLSSQSSQNEKYFQWAHDCCTSMAEVHQMWKESHFLQNKVDGNINIDHHPERDTRSHCRHTRK